MLSAESTVGILHMMKNMNDVQPDVQQEGQSAVEFALILPVLLLIVLGIIQFGLIFSAQISLENAVREGARTAAVLGQTEGNGNPNINARVHQAGGGLDQSKMRIFVTPNSNSSRWAGTAITVTVSYSAPVVVPIINGIIGNSIALSSSSTTRSEQ